MKFREKYFSKALSQVLKIGFTYTNLLYVNKNVVLTTVNFEKFSTFTYDIPLFGNDMDMQNQW
jgi:hypothetical protein